MRNQDVARSAGAGTLPAAIFGFGVAGLLDALLLHHLLGWHHLTGPGPVTPHALRIELGFQALMTLCALSGVALLLWQLDSLRRMSPRVPAGAALTGFGLWHLVDAVLVHWVLGLHRVRPGAEMPLIWDLVWLVCFGLFPILLGRVVRLRGQMG